MSKTKKVIFSGGRIAVLDKQVHVYQCNKTTGKVQRAPFTEKKVKRELEIHIKELPDFFYLPASSEEQAEAAFDFVFTGVKAKMIKFTFKQRWFVFSESIKIKFKRLINYLCQ